MLLSSMMVLYSLIAIITSNQVDQKLRHKQRKHRFRPKLSSNTAGAFYGVELPSFSFDYRELVISAIIERSSENDDLFLTMALMGHRSVFQDFPFETISTEEEIFHRWGEAVHQWVGRKNITTPYSGMNCVIRNDDQKQSTPYSVPALWIPVSSMQDSNIHGNLEFLRCAIRGSSNAYEVLSNGDSFLSIDLIKKPSTKIKEKKSPPFKAQSSTINRNDLNQTVGSPSTISVSTSTSYDQSAAILSFSIPWRTRFTGYGLHFAADAETSSYSSYFDPWQSATKDQFDGSLSVSPITTGANTTQTSKTSKPPTNQLTLPVRLLSSAASGLSSQQPPRVEPRVFLCVPGLRPMHPQGPLVGMPQLIEFVEHHLSIGFEHIFVGVYLDWCVFASTELLTWTIFSLVLLFSGFVYIFILYWAKDCTPSFVDSFLLLLSYNCLIIAVFQEVYSYDSASSNS